MTFGFPAPIKGTVKIDLKEFPPEVLERITTMAQTGMLPVLNLNISRLIMSSGVNVNSTWETSDIEFEFESNDFVIEVSK